MLAPLLLPLSPHPSSIPCSVVSLQSSLILGEDITEIRQIDSPPFPFFLLFHFSWVGLHFCASLGLKRGIKWPWIAQEVGVSSWCRDMQSEGEEGEQGKKGHDEVTSSFWSSSSPLLFANWLSFFLRVCSLQIRLFFVQSLSSLQPLFLWPHLLAGVINDLTDTLDEQCCESVKQVVIKTDAVSLWRGDKRRQKEGERERDEREEKRMESA